MLRRNFPDAKARPQGGAVDAIAGVGNAKTDSITDRLTRDHRMTLDEAHLILNAKKGEPFEGILKVRVNALDIYEHLN
jgi:import inner membrane translocase subunit TIM16